MKDFAWWSGLRMQDAQRGLDMAGRQLTHEIVDGKAYWFFLLQPEILKLRTPGDGNALVNLR